MTRTYARRRAADPTAWARALSNSQPTGHAEAVRITNLIRIAFENLKAGTGDADDFSRLAAAINVGIVRGEAIDQEVVDVMNRACEALLECSRRFAQHGRFGFAGPELAAVADAIDWYSQILEASTPNQMEAAVHESMRRITRGDGYEPAHSANDSNRRTAA